MHPLVPAFPLFHVCRDGKRFHAAKTDLKGPFETWVHPVGGYIRWLPRTPRATNDTRVDAPYHVVFAFRYAAVVKEQKDSKRVRTCAESVERDGRIRRQTEYKVIDWRDPNSPLVLNEILTSEMNSHGRLAIS